MHKVLVGEASETEVAELEQWLALDPVNATEFEELKLLYWDSWNADMADTGSSDNSWNKIEKAIHRIQTRQKYFSYLKVAAMATGIYALMIWGYAATSSATHNALVESPGDMLSQTIHYRDIPIEEVVMAIEDNYDFNVTLASSELGECKFTGSFKRGTSIQEVIETLAMAKDLTVVYTTEHSVLLSGGPCKM